MRTTPKQNRRTLQNRSKLASITRFSHVKAVAQAIRSKYNEVVARHQKKTISIPAMKKEHCNQKRNKIVLVQEFLCYSDGYTRTNIIRVVKIMQLYGLTLEK